MLQTADPDTLSLLDFELSIEDCCESIRLATGVQCDQAAEYRVAVTCDSHHTRNILMCSNCLVIAQRDSFSCLRCEQVGSFDLVTVLAVAPIKK